MKKFILFATIVALINIIAFTYYILNSNPTFGQVFIFAFLISTLGFGLYLVAIQDRIFKNNKPTKF